MEYINRYLRRAVANGPRQRSPREGMCYAQYLAGMAFNNASLGHVHAMAHQLGGFYDLPLASAMPSCCPMCANTTVFPAVAALAASLSCWVGSPRA